MDLFSTVGGDASTKVAYATPFLSSQRWDAYARARANPIGDLSPARKKTNHREVGGGKGSVRAGVWKCLEKDL